MGEARSEDALGASVPCKHLPGGLETPFSPKRIRARGSDQFKPKADKVFGILGPLASSES